LQVAEDDGLAVELWEPVDFLMHDRLAFPVRPGVLHGRAGRVRDREEPPFVGLPSRDRRPGTRPDAEGDLVEPRAQRVVHPERVGLAHQHQERRLEGIQRVLFVTQGRPADAEDHRAVTADDLGEGQLGEFVLSPDEPLQQRSVGHASDRAKLEERAEKPRRLAIPIERHRSQPPSFSKHR
jgi:hypothetical protein